MKNLTPELIEKARAAKNAEELLTLAKENNVEMTEESAKAYFEQLHPASGELSDDELNDVSGGGCHTSDGRLVVTVGHICGYWQCKNCSDHGYGFGDRNNMDVHTCPDMCGGGKVFACCDTCSRCSYEKGLWLCNLKFI